MSIQWLNAAWETETGSPTRKAVLMVLADHANEDGVCWPKVTTIARKTELSERTVRDAIKTLEDDDVIRVSEQYEQRGKQIQNSYQILQRGAGAAPLGVRELHPTGARAAPPTRTTNEPSGRTKPMRPPAAGRTAGRAADESLPLDDDGPALGAPSRDEVREQEQQPARRSPRSQSSDRTPAAERGDTTHACALRFKEGMKARGAIDPANLRQLSATLKRWHKDGLEIDELREMVDTFIARPDAYMTGKQDIPWRAFINAREKLAADARKKVEASNPTAKFGKGKQRFEERTALR